MAGLWTPSMDLTRQFKGRTPFGAHPHREGIVQVHIVADERWSLGVLRASQQPPFIQRWRADLFELNIWLEVDGVRVDENPQCTERGIVRSRALLVQKTFSLRSSLLISITPCPLDETDGRDRSISYQFGRTLLRLLPAFAGLHCTKAACLDGIFGDARAQQFCSLEITRPRRLIG